MSAETEYWERMNDGAVREQLHNTGNCPLECEFCCMEEREGQVENDCEDQDIVPTKVCVLFGCDRADLVPRGGFYVCSKCSASYGRSPHPDLPPYSDDRFTDRGAPT